MNRKWISLLVTLTLVVVAFGVLSASRAMAAPQATKMWDGGAGTSNWSDANNWDDNVVPASGDNVVLDNSLVSGSYTVNLPTGATTVAINRLTITPDTGNTITLVLPSGNTASPGFNVGDNAAGTDDIILNNGAILKNSSGATSGNGIQANSTANGTVRINNGGKYIHNTLRSTAGIVPLLSTVAGTETGIFEFDVPGTGSFAISASGRNYGSLTLTRTAGAATYTASGGSALTIRGNFTINTGVTFNSTMTGAMNLAGNLTNNGSALTLSQPANLNGTGEQTIGGSNTVAFNNLTINSGAILIESTNVTVNGTLTNNGTIRNILTGNGTGNLTGVALANFSGLTNLQIDRIDSNIPSGNAALNTGYYWVLTPTGAGSVDITLPNTPPKKTPIANANRTCYDSGTAGYPYTCSTDGSFTITGITDTILNEGNSKNWAIGANAGPNALHLRTLTANAAPNPRALALPLLGLTALGGGLLALRRRAA
jgi:hypothetical protein